MRFERIPYVTCVIAIINVIAFFLECRRGQRLLIQEYGMHKGALRTRRGWIRLVSSAFLHTNIAHLACNMFCLISFGLSLENNIGPLEYLLIYAAGILGAGVLINYAGGSGNHVGASGAIWALMCATLVFNLVHHYDPLYALQGIALNLIYSFVARVSWQGHIGGGIGGLAAALIIYAAGGLV